ncbi:MAG: PadR family transcriptional regulator [Anaerolineae bacterium]|nr:PadR family transcriptional regulator [Anaerolineae bacterium]
MSIEYSILGLLSWKPLTGYDLKKIMSDSSLFYWSGNNNQIYRSLLQLYHDGFISQQVQLQESLPAKKIYSITDNGSNELRHWLLTQPSPPEVRHSFLLQLAWADCLTTEEIISLLDRYEKEVEARQIMQLEKNRRGNDTPRRTAREAFLWEKISENVIAQDQNELNWVRQMRRELLEKGF